MARYFRLIIFILLLTYLTLCAIVFSYQRSLIYHPTPNNSYETANTIPFNVDGATLKLYRKENSTNKAVLFFGGNAENVAITSPKYAQTLPDYAFFAANYRGYSGSTGEPTEAGIHTDALKLYDKVKAKYSHITVIGRSLGSGVAVKLASERDVKKLILITPFDSILNIAKLRFPFLPVNIMLKDRFESSNYAPKVEAPTLVLAGENDWVIPLANTQTLYSTFKPNVASLKIFKNADHHTISDTTEYYESISSFIKASE